MRWHPGRGLRIDFDPPYGVSDVKNYDGWWTEQMTEFNTCVQSLTGKWIVTHDDSEFNRDLWHGHDIDFVSTRNGSGNQSVGPTRFFGEIIIYSPGLRP